MEDYSKELTSEQEMIKAFTDPLNKRIKKLELDKKELKKQLILSGVVHCFGKDDLQYVYEDVDTNFKSFEDWFKEYTLPI